MKTSKNIFSHLSLVTFSLIALISYGQPASAGDPEKHKLYEITDDGKFIYNYQLQEYAPKTGQKLITVRTFYLETIRKGLIPSTVSYLDFVEMTTAEKQELLAQQSLLDYEKRSAEIAEAKAHTASWKFLEADNTNPAGDDVQPLEYISAKGVGESSYYDFAQADLMTTEEVALEGYLLNIPWIVQVIVAPYEGFVVPEDADVKKALSGLK